MASQVGHAFPGAPSYVTVAASQTTATLTERSGTYIHSLVIQPAAVACGVVTLYDGKGTGLITVLAWPGGAGTALLGLEPIVVPMGWISVNRAGTLTSEGWYVTTGANVSLVANVQIR